MKDFKNTEFELYEYLIRMRELYRTNGLYDEYADRLNKDIESIQTRKFDVAVMGEFKRGKSSLINALLGVKVLPADVTPATATINRITYGSEPSMTICYTDGTTEDASLSDIADYVTHLTEEGRRRASSIREAVVRYPTVICQNHVDIIDTPGLNDNEAMTRITMNMLGSVDAVIIVISALSPFSETEAKFTARLIEDGAIDNILFAVTYMDQVDDDEWDKVLGAVRKRISSGVDQALEGAEADVIARKDRVLADAPLWGVSTVWALKSFVTGDSKLLKKSGFGIFKEELYSVLTSRQGLHMIQRGVESIDQYCSEFEDATKRRIADIKTQFERISECETAVRSYEDTCKRVFSEAVTKRSGENQALFESIEAVKNDIKEAMLSCLGGRGDKYKDDDIWQADDARKAVRQISSEAAACFDRMNGDVSRSLKEGIESSFAAAVRDFGPYRHEGLVSRISEFNSDGMHISLLPYFDQDVGEIMESFGYPVFSWVDTPVSKVERFSLSFAISRIEKACDNSFDTFCKHWRMYLDGALKWWESQIGREVDMVTTDMRLYSRRAKDKLLKEAATMESSLLKQKESIKEITEKLSDVRTEYSLV